jgi:hypothetical protein
MRAPLGVGVQIGQDHDTGSGTEGGLCYAREVNVAGGARHSSAGLMLQCQASGPKEPTEDRGRVETRKVSHSTYSSGRPSRSSDCQERVISNGRARHVVCCYMSSVENEGNVVDVAVAPVLARFGGPHDGVAGIPEVRGGMLAGFVVAATDVPAPLTHAQVHPPTAARESLLATSNALGQLVELDAVEM